MDEVMETIGKNTPMEFTLIRKVDQKEYQTGIMPLDGKIKSLLRYSDIHINSQYQESFDFFPSLKKWLSETLILSRVTIDFLWKTLHDIIIPNSPEDREIAKEMISWPIGMSAGMVELVEIGISLKSVLVLVAFLSLNLWVLNILPFPALDGWRIVSTTIISCMWWFTHKKSLLRKAEQSVHAFGMIILIGLSLLIAFHDIFKL